MLRHKHFPKDGIILTTEVKGLLASVFFQEIGFVVFEAVSC